MQVIVDWTCDLDYSEKNCLPEYSFRRLDKGDYSISRGFNFRLVSMSSMSCHQCHVRLFSA